MSFTDFVKIQEDTAYLLLSDPWLVNVNVVTRDKLLTPQSLARLPDKTLAAEVLAYLTPRAGRKGCGVIVEIPEFNVQSPNVTGPQGDLILPFLVLEDPLENEAPKTGTLRPANQVAQRILDLLHHDADEGNGTARGEGRAIVPAPEWEPLRAYRVTLRMTHPRARTAPCAAVTINIDAGLATLTCAGAEQIFYTLDETYPGPGNPQALLYSAPFAVQSGDIIRAAGYAENFRQGPRRRYTVP